MNILFSTPVPYYAQAASPDCISSIFDRGLDPAEDPRWAEWDCADREEYRRWCPRACGPVCVKMAVEALGGLVLPVMQWVRSGLAEDGYQVKEAADGIREEIGWRHEALAALICSAGLAAEALAAGEDELTALLGPERLAIASVSYELGTSRPVTRRGGHLVVLIGASFRHGHPTAFTIHNPSGRTARLREYARIPAARFFEAYAGRAIAITALTPTAAAGARPIFRG